MRFSGFGVELIKVVQCQTKGMDDRKGQHAVRVSPLPAFDFCSVKEGLDHFGALASHQILDHVQPTEIRHSPCRIVASNISLLDCATGSQLCTLNVARGDVLLGGEETEPLEVGDLLTNMLVDRCGEVHQFGREWEPVLMDDHVDLVRLQQRFGALREVNAQRIEVGFHLVDVAKRGARTRCCGEDSTVRPLRTVQPPDLCIGVVARGMVGFVHDQQRNLTQVDGAVGGVVAHHLGCGHENPAMVPHGLSLLWGCFTGVGHNAFFVHLQKLPCHTNVLVHQTGGRSDQDDFVLRRAEVFRHHHPLDGGFSETGWHHHQAGAGERPFKGTELIGPCLHAIP